MGRLLAVVIAVAVAQGSLRVQGLDGSAVDPLAMPKDVKAIVFLFTSTDCPISNRYAPEVKRLASAFVPQGVLFRLVYPDPHEGQARTEAVLHANGDYDADAPPEQRRAAMARWRRWLDEQV